MVKSHSCTISIYDFHIPLIFLYSSYSHHALSTPDDPQEWCKDSTYNRTVHPTLLVAGLAPLLASFFQPSTRISISQQSYRRENRSFVRFRFNDQRKSSYGSPYFHPIY
ncbi:hypothetical protein POPTR_006G196300v4 [Populus trichocarpa]|uniref:Uncharacterized protein n=1 Tax=Populus trichocarpa TaxID=3694 RepID=A0ACC0SVD3_POPTR|nr:hypothetical protein POPTR_006G196300v4 [Populus trichocarpa]